MLASVCATALAAEATMRLAPPELVYGLDDTTIIGMVLFFAACGWIMGKFHEAVLWRVGDAVAKARIVQGIVASFVAAIFAFWLTTPYWHYPLLAGCGAATIFAYLGQRAVELAAALGLDGLKAVMDRAVGKRTPSP